jgi:hypothetical protein
MSTPQQPTLTTDLVPVTVENFPRAESDLYFSSIVKRGGFGKFDHNREPTPIDGQTIIRMNRDTTYSAAVFDLDVGAVTITLPDAGDHGDGVGRQSPISFACWQRDRF